MSDEIADVINLFRDKPQLTADEPQLTAQQKMHAYWEGRFRHHGLTLTDPTTAESARAAITVMDHVLEGACAKDVINEEQRDTLRALIHVGLSAIDELQG